MKYLLLLVALNLAAQDPREIMSRVMERDENNLALLNTYMFERRSIMSIFEKDGKLKKTTEEVHEVFHVDGTEIEKLIQKNGNDLSPKEQAAEQKRVDKQIEKIQKESPSARAKRRRERDKDKQEEIEARREVLEAFDFQLVGEKQIHGRQCWGIRGEPRPGFQGKGRRADQMKKVRGAVWIDQTTYELTRMELDTHDTISFGWFLLRLQPGAQIRMDQRLINEEVWLPVALNVRADARLLGKIFRVGVEVRFDKFRKFSSDSKLIVADQ